MKVKDYPKTELPRERLEKFGPSVLNDSDLLAVILGRGVKGANVFDLSKGLLAKFGSFNKWDNLTLNKLNMEKGLGKSQSLKLIACVELSKRIKFPNNDTKRILKLEDAGSVFVPLFVGKKNEVFAVAALDARFKVIAAKIISEGTVNSSLAHPREIFKFAVDNLASYIIVAHNHPSGELEPSREDIEITKVLHGAGKILRIPLKDHIIFCGTKFVGLKDLGLF